jgi:ribosomal protein L27
VTSTLAVGTDFVQATPDSTGKKLGFKLAGSGLYLPGTVLTDDTGATIDGSTAALAGTERGLVVRALIQGAPITAQTGTLTTATSNVAATGITAAGNVQLTVSGTYGFTTTNPAYILEASDDTGTNWYPVTGLREDTNTHEATGTLPVNGLRSWLIDMAGFDRVRIRITAWGTPTGSIAVRFTPGGMLFLPPPAPYPTNATELSLTAANTTGATSDTILTLTPTRDGVAGSTGTSFTPTSGKRIALTAMSVTWRNATAAAGGVICFLRSNGAGATVATSPLLFALASGALTAATIGHSNGATVIFPKPIVLVVGGSVGVSQLALGAVAGLYMTLQGYEY